MRKYRSFADGLATGTNRPLLAGPGTEGLRQERAFRKHAPNASVRPSAALQDRPCERAESARKRAEPERDGCTGAVVRNQIANASGRTPPGLSGPVPHMGRMRRGSN